MGQFKYKVRDEKGNAIRGTIDALSLGAAVDRLKKLGYTVVSIQPAAPLFSFNFSLPFLSPIKTEEYVMLTTQLAAILGAGVGLTTGLDVLVEQTENKRLKNAVQAVSDEIKGGASFADALRKQSDVFPNIFINMVAAGEVAGNLEEVLSRLAVFMEKQADFQQKVISALFYPVILLVFSFAVVILITVTVLPAFVSMFLEAGVPLPLPTLILYRFNLLLRHQWFLLILLAAALYFLFRHFKSTRTGKSILDRLMLDLPVMGALTHKVQISNLSRTLCSLLAAGVPVLQALDTLEKTTDNSVFSRVIRDAYDHVSKGGTLAEQLKSSGEFPPMPVKMIAVGEESGSLDKMLGKIADFYEMSVDYSLKRLTALIEPFFLVIVGGLVGCIVASVILPMFRMVSTIKR